MCVEGTQPITYELFETLLKARDERDQLQAENQRLRAKLTALVKSIEAEPMPTGEPAESVWIGRQQVADEIKADLEAAKED